MDHEEKDFGGVPLWRKMLDFLKDKIKENIIRNEILETERENEEKLILEENRWENLPKLMKDIKPHIQQILLILDKILKKKREKHI